MKYERFKNGMVLFLFNENMQYLTFYREKNNCKIAPIGLFFINGDLEFLNFEIPENQKDVEIISDEFHSLFRNQCRENVSFIEILAGKHNSGLEEKELKTFVSIINFLENNSYYKMMDKMKLSAPKAGISKLNFNRFLFKSVINFIDEIE